MRQQMLQLVPFDETAIDRNKGMIEVKRPIVESEIPGQGKLKLEFDVKQFKPEEVEVKVMGNNMLQINALHEEKSDTGYSRRQYCRQYLLPEGVHADKIQPSLTQDGVLTIEAPAPAPGPKEKKIPIEYKK
nr:small heat shock protein [Polygordius sp. ID5]